MNEVPVVSNFKPRIGVLKKDLRHRFVNHDQIVEHLKTRFPDYEVIGFHPPSLPDVEEVNIVSGLDLLITPSGGTSFTLQYLPDCASVIIGDVCWPSTKIASFPSNGNEFLSYTGSLVKCMHVESHIWERMTHLRRFYYVHPNITTVINDTPTNPHPSRPAFDYSYSALFEVLDPLVDKALSSINAEIFDTETSPSW